MYLSLLSANLKWYPLLFDSPLNVARGVCFWLTIALALAFLICLPFFRGANRKKFLKIFLLSVLFYALCVGVLLLSFTFAEDGLNVLLFAPLLTLFTVCGASAFVLVFRRKKSLLIASGCCVGGALLAVLVCMGVYYATQVDHGYYINVNQAVLYCTSIAFVALLLGLAFLFGRKDKKKFDSKSISYASICIALSFALSFLRVFKLPQGGSVTVASLLPLMIYSYMFGTKKGVFAGFVYGILQAVQDPWIIHPAQFLLDYPVAFACIGLSGIFGGVTKLQKYPPLQFVLGAIFASVLRFGAHLLSGVFAFSAYALDAGMSAWIYSLSYNSFVFIDVAVAIAVGIFVFCSKTFVKQARKFRFEPPNPTKTENI